MSYSDKIHNPDKLDSFILDEFGDKIFRVAKKRNSYLDGVDLKFSTINLEETKKLKQKNKEKFMEGQKKILNVRTKNKELINFLKEKFKHYVETDIKFLVARIYTINNPESGKPEIKKIDSDKKRLFRVFDEIRKVNSDVKIQKRILELIMEDWYAWPKCTPGNLVGFLERSSEDLSKFTFKIKKEISAPATIQITGHKKEEYVQKQRKYFG